MNTIDIVGIVVIVFAVTLLAGFMIWWEMAHRSMLKRVQAVNDAAARVAQKLSVGHPATAAGTRGEAVEPPRGWGQRAMNRSTYFGMLFAMLSVGLAAMCLILGEQGRVESSYSRGWAAGSNSVASRPVPPPMVVTQQFSVLIVTNKPEAVDIDKMLNDTHSGDLVIPEPTSPFDLPLPK